MNKVLNVLIVTEKPALAALVSETLQMGGLTASIRIVNNWSGLKTSLESMNWDIVFSEAVIGQLHVRRISSLVHSLQNHPTVVVIQDSLDLPTGLRLLEEGADEVVDAGDPVRIGLVAARCRQTADESQRAPEPSFPDQDSLAEIMDMKAVQKVLTAFNRLTDMGVAIGDLDGNILAAAGGQDICMRFHRVNPVTNARCRGSDLLLESGLALGEYLAYKCKNGLWDVISPLFVEERHVGNIYTGQFLYEDEDIDRQMFAEQAAWYGFNHDDYMKALDAVPRHSRRKVESLVSFLAEFARLISGMGNVNTKLHRAIVDKNGALAALKESEERLCRITEGARQMPFRMRISDGYYEYVGSAGEYITGYSPDAFRENPGLIRHIIHPDWLSYLDMEWKNLQEGRVPSYYEFQIVHKNGEIRWLHQDNLLVRDEAGRPVALEGLVSDVTDCKVMERRIAHERLILRSMVDSVPEIMYMKDPAGAYLGCNLAYAELLGCSESEIIGHTDYDLLTVEEACVARRTDQKVMCEGGAESVTRVWNRQGGKLLTFEILNYPYYGPHGECLGVIGVGRQTEQPAIGMDSEGPGPRLRPPARRLESRLAGNGN